MEEGGGGTLRCERGGKEDGVGWGEAWQGHPFIGVGGRRRRPGRAGGDSTEHHQCCRY
jgi:hypothetical protein